MRWSCSCLTASCLTTLCPPVLSFDLYCPLYLGPFGIIVGMELALGAEDGQTRKKVGLSQVSSSEHPWK